MKNVEAYLAKNKTWEKELLLLLEILDASELEGSIKWGAPVYSLNGKNVVGVGAFKSYLGLWFFQGVFLKDAKGLLVNAQEGKTKALRQMRFESISDDDLLNIKAYVEEAIANQKAGKEMKAEKKALEIPQELLTALTDKSLQSAFDSFTPGKQKEFANYIGEAKQEKTRLNRLEKVKVKILNGEGLYDKYKNC